MPIINKKQLRTLKCNRNGLEVIVMKNYAWENKTLHINRQRRVADGKIEGSKDRRRMIIEGIILKPYDRRQNNDSNYNKPERRNRFDRRSIFDRRGQYELWMQSKVRLIKKAAQQSDSFSILIEMAGYYPTLHPDNNIWSTSA